MLKNYLGKKFGRWTVIGETEKVSVGKYYASCQCECGVIKTIRIGNVRSGMSKSCGCLLKELNATGLATKHGLTRSKVRNAWSNMRQRCCNKNYKYYYTYGGRGIKVCKRWEKFINFLEDMGFPPEESRRISLDRINNDGNYEPGNCRWTSIDVQNTNKTNTLNVTYMGVTKPLIIWAKDLGVPYIRLFSRYYDYGWSIEDTLTKPKNYKHKKDLTAP